VYGVKPRLQQILSSGDILSDFSFCYYLQALSVAYFSTIPAVQPINPRSF
jgi:hypothetical protein